MKTKVQLSGRIVLEDGAIFEGWSFGYEGKDQRKDQGKDLEKLKEYKTTGEIVFNTSMSGYQEILTDPSYRGQIVVMTYPMIGNYGVNRFDVESNRVQVQALVVREYSKHYSNFRAEQSLQDYLIKEKIPALEGVDTRRLTRRIRDGGALRALMVLGNGNSEDWMAQVLQSPQMLGQNLAESISTLKPFCFPEKRTNELYHVVAVDLGIKTNILRIFSQWNCFVTVVPAGYSASEILALNPDGIFLSNGPGDPATLKGIVGTVRDLLDQESISGNYGSGCSKPIFGICLGHQILSQALGAKTYKLKFGHRGANHPVRNQKQGSIEITSQNYGFAVDPKTLPEEVEITHVNLNDQCVEGIRHKTLPVFSVQYHPESSPGPHDSRYLFEDFVCSMRKMKKITETRKK